MKALTPILTLLAAMVAGALPAQTAGELDSTFGGDGKVITAIGARQDFVAAMVLQPDGRIVAAGYTNNGANVDFALARYYPEGSLDTTFGTGGKVTTVVGTGDDYPGSLALQPDGKLVVAGGVDDDFGNPGYTLVRYNTNGSLDTAFGGGGILSTDMHVDLGAPVMVQPDGKIIAVGYMGNNTYDFTVYRYHADGSFDHSFSNGGKATIDFANVANFPSAASLQPDGKIVVTGLSIFEGPPQLIVFAVARLNADGTPDSTFNHDGQVHTDLGFGGQWGYTSALQPDGKMVIAGTANVNDFHQIVVVRYTANGFLDEDFGSGGLVITDYDGELDEASSIAIQADGKIVFAGSSGMSTQDGRINYDFAMARLHPNGATDNSFGINGTVRTHFGVDTSSCAEVMIQPDGKIIMAGCLAEAPGDWNFALARYLPRLSVGIADLSFAENMWIYPNPVQQTEVLEYSLAKEERVTISLFDMSGRLIKPFVVNEHRGKGTHRESLNFENAIAAGTYVLTIGNIHGSESIRVTKQ